MKQLYIIVSFFLASSVAFGQCQFVDVSVSSSDTSYVQLYHPGFFLLPSGNANVCEWEVTTASGEIVFETTTSGAAFEQGSVLFDHTVPITDSMFVNLLISNPVSGLTCLITNTLYWEETEVLPSIFIGNWNVIGFNPGVATAVDEAGISAERDFALFPSPAMDHLRIDAPRSVYALTIWSATGALVHSEANFMTSQPIDVSLLQPGIYFVGLQDERGVNRGMQKFIKG
ncbi:MAG: T9SS type A sorting domain-containing protein [Flavobacteriales bacterium]|jgi:hypothetical protein|nr:T9SS type A sorting domain-containing protein [Flavobacteriales bacterium]